MSGALEPGSRLGGTDPQARRDDSERDAIDRAGPDDVELAAPAGPTPAPAPAAAGDGVGVLVLDRDGRVVAADPMFRELFSAGGADPAGGGCHAALCGRPAPCADCPGIRAARDGVLSRREMRLWIDDRFRDVLALGIPGRREEGQARLLVVDVGNLEAVRRSDGAFRVSEQRFRSLFERVPAGMVTLRIDGAILQTNPAFCTMLGYTRSELLGRSLVELIHPQDAERIEEERQRLVACERTSVETEVRYVRRDGSVAWGHTTAVLQLDRDNAPAYTVALVQDITRGKRAERQLERSEQNYQGLVNSIDGIVWEADPATMRFEFVSERAGEILGFPPEKWLSQPRFWRNHIHPEDLDRVMQRFAVATQRGGAFEVEYRMMAADGRTVWIRDRVSVVTLAGESPRMRGLMTDITEQRRARRALEQSEARLRQAQKMEAVGRLAGDIAHDFSNMLTAIAGYGDLLVRGLGSRHPLRRDAEAVTVAAQHAAELTQQLLAFGRQQVLRPEVLELNRFVAEADMMLRRVLGEGVELELELGAGQTFVEFDPAQLQQVLVNLAMNAREAMPAGGRFLLQVEQVELDRPPDDLPALTPGRWVCLAATDNGAGMDAATRERAFEPFFTTRPERGGSGLGLATVFGVVRQSQGHLRVESEPGEGARFEIWLPPVEGRPRLADEEPDDGPELEPGSGSVLVLEDDPSVRKLAVEILRSCGYDAVAAAGRDDALAAARERAVDLLVADMRLARRDGGDVADEVRAVRPRVRVLYLAGQGDAAWLDGTLGESDAAFLHKPFTPASLSHCVRELLEGRA